MTVAKGDEVRLFFTRPLIRPLYPADGIPGTVLRAGRKYAVAEFTYRQAKGRPPVLGSQTTREVSFDMATGHVQADTDGLLVKTPARLAGEERRKQALSWLGSYRIDVGHWNRMNLPTGQLCQLAAVARSWEKQDAAGQPEATADLTGPTEHLRYAEVKTDAGTIRVNTGLETAGTEDEEPGRPAGRGNRGRSEGRRLEAGPALEPGPDPREPAPGEETGERIMRLLTPYGMSEPEKEGQPGIRPRAPRALTHAQDQGLAPTPRKTAAAALKD